MGEVFFNRVAAEPFLAALNGYPQTPISFFPTAAEREHWH